MVKATCKSILWVTCCVSVGARPGAGWVSCPAGFCALLCQVRCQKAGPTQPIIVNHIIKGLHYYCLLEATLTRWAVLNQTLKSHLTANQLRVQSLQFRIRLWTLLRKGPWCAHVHVPKKLQVAKHQPARSPLQRMKRTERALSLVFSHGCKKTRTRAENPLLMSDDTFIAINSVGKTEQKGGKR